MLADETIVAPELVLYEVTNSIWKHEHLLKDIEDGKAYIAIFYGLVKAAKITILSPDENLMQQAYEIAKETRTTIYDALFVALAIKLNLSLKTFDKVQAGVLEKKR